MILYYVIIQNRAGSVKQIARNLPSQQNMNNHSDFSATAWSSPRNIPGWVLKRVQPLTAEQVQEVAWMDNLTLK